VTKSNKNKTKITKTKLVLKPGKAGSVTMAFGKRKRKTSPTTQASKDELIKQIKLQEEKRKQGKNPQNPTNTQTTGNLSFDKNKKLSNEIEGEKYLIVHRTDEGLTMKDMSPIMLETAFKSVTNNGKITCRTLKSGDILIKTENVKQAKSLTMLTKIAHVNIEVSEHRSLNTCRGVVSAYELKYEDEDTMLEYLKPQNVTKIDFHMKTVGNERVKSGLAFVTFGKNEPPEYLTIGCLKLKVRPYVPAPMRCFVCHKFGHISKNCPNSNAPKCYNCCEDKHIETREEKCTRPQKCANCGSTEHNSYNRNCNELKRQVTIQTIRVTQKVSFSEAVKLSNLQRNTYAQITASSQSQTTPTSPKNQTDNPVCKCPHCGYHKASIKPHKSTQRPTIDYGDLSPSKSDTEHSDTEESTSAEIEKEVVEEESSDKHE
jgi:hypothetical protein